MACPDVLLLDEPTNHLDAAAIEWLQSWLDRYPGALVLVTHDRYVLDRVTRRMVEVDQGRARTYQGNYSTFLQHKAEEDASEAASAAKFRGVLRRELAWLRQGPKARSTKQRARLQRIEAMREDKPSQAKGKLEMASVSRRIGKQVIEAEALGVTANGQPDGQRLLDDFSYSFSPEDRVGILGPNGSGKSTLLDLIAGRRQATEGTLRLGDTIHIGYLDQHTDAFDQGKGLDRKVIEFVEEAASRIDLGGEQVTASQLLERFLFPPAQQHSPLSKLSGGERRRLTLCRMLVQAPNVLLLDEPPMTLTCKRSVFWRTFWKTSEVASSSFPTIATFWIERWIACFASTTADSNVLRGITANSLSRRNKSSGRKPSRQHPPKNVNPTSP